MNYMKPEMEVMQLNVNDIIITSLGDGDVHEEGKDGPTTGWK